MDRDSPLAIPPALLEGQGLKFGGESAIEDEDLERVKDVLVLYNVWLPGSLKTRGLVAAVDQRYKVETTTQARQLFKTLEDRFKNQAPPPGDKRTDISGQIQLGDQAFALRSRSPEGNTNYIFIFREETTVAVIVLGYATKADERQAFSIAEGTAKRVEKAVR